MIYWKGKGTGLVFRGDFLYEINYNRSIITDWEGNAAHLKDVGRVNTGGKG
jgi:hypothetical protein